MSKHETHAHTRLSPIQKNFTTFYGFIDNFWRQLFSQLFMALLTIFYGFFDEVHLTQ
jgi:hypothetical protein